MKCTLNKLKLSENKEVVAKANQNGDILFENHIYWDGQYCKFEPKFQSKESHIKFGGLNEASLKERYPFLELKPEKWKAIIVWMFKREANIKFISRK